METPDRDAASLVSGRMLAAMARLRTGDYDHNMSAGKPTAIELPEDLREFAEQRVKSGRYPSVVDVVRDAFAMLREREEKVSALRDALDEGINQLDAGDYIEGTPKELAKGLRDGRAFDEM